MGVAAPDKAGKAWVEWTNGKLAFGSASFRPDRDKEEKMRKLLSAVVAAAALLASAGPPSRAGAIPAAPAGLYVSRHDEALTAQAHYVRVREAGRYRYRSWPPECVVRWQHYWRWGHRYSCFGHAHLHKHAGPR